MQLIIGYFIGRMLVTVIFIPAIIKVKSKPLMIFLENDSETISGNLLLQFLLLQEYLLQALDYLPPQYPCILLQVWIIRQVLR